MPLIQTSAPGVEPLTRDEAKSHLRVDADYTVDDALIDMLIGAARIAAETQTARSLISQGWRLVLDRFPGSVDMWLPDVFQLPGNAILLERGPLLAVSSITYTDMGGVQQTLTSGTDYVVDASGPIPRITPPFGRIWPIPLPQIGAVRVDYTAGYGTTAASVPAGIRHWMLLRVASLYEHREEAAVMQRGTVNALPWVDGLLDPYRVVWA